MKFYIPIFIISMMVISGCSSSGGATSEEPDTELEESTVNNESLSCPSNQIENGDICECPDSLVLQGEYCIDFALSVKQGAEYLERGFPVIVTKTGGVHTNPLYLKYGNIDQDPELELIYAPGASPFIYAVDSNGEVLEGWPTNASTGLHSKVVLGQFDGDAELEVFAGHKGTAYEFEQCELNLFDYDGSIFPGWPAGCGLQINIAPVAIDLDYDGFDEVVYSDSTRSLSYIDRSGQITDIIIDNLPRGHSGWCGFAAGNITGDEADELIILSCNFNDYTDFSNVLRQQRQLMVLDGDLNPAEGFPVQFRGNYNAHPIVGDIDQDGFKEIIVSGGDSCIENTTCVNVYSHDGELEKKIVFNGRTENTGPLSLAVADLDQENGAEIFMSISGLIHAVNYQSEENIPGFPVVGGWYFAIGDVDGGGDEEVVTFLERSGADLYDNDGVLAVYKSDGELEPKQIVVDYMGRDPAEVMPSIVDFDLDGRNEIIAVGEYWEGSGGYFPQIWAFDLIGDNYGPISWGQMFGDERNTGKALAE